MELTSTLRTLPIIAVLCLGGFAGCKGYSSQPLTIDNARSIAVPMFDNQTFWRGLEFDLTKAVSNEVISRSGLRLAPSNSADLVLSGDVIDYKRPVLTEGTQDIVKEGSIRAIVHIVIRKKNGDVIVDKNLVAKKPFVVDRGETEKTARAEAFENLAEDIVNLLERQW